MSAADPHYYEGTFEPGAKLNGRTVRSWHVTSTSAPRECAGRTYRDVKIAFTDGSHVYAVAIDKQKDECSRCFNRGSIERERDDVGPYLELWRLPCDRCARGNNVKPMRVS